MTIRWNIDRHHSNHLSIKYLYSTTSNSALFTRTFRIFVPYDFQVSRNNRYARVPAGAAERDKLTWHSYSPAAPFFGLLSQFHYYNRKVLSLGRHSANGKVRLLRSCELIRPKLLCPFVEFHKAIFWVGGWAPYSLPRFSNLLPSHYKLLGYANNVTGADASVVSLYAAEHPFFRIVRRKLLYVVSAEGQRNAAPPYNPVRRNWPHVSGLWECYLAAQNSKSRLSAVANKSCLKGRPYKIWSCAPAPDGCRPHVCAASTGGRVSRPAPGAVSALDSSLSEVASLCSIGTAPFFKPIPPHTNPQNGTRIDEQCKTP